MIERLEEIKMDNERYHQEVVFSSKVLSDIKWLINRVEKLESRIEVLGTTLDQEVMVSQRYKQALGFYANEENYNVADIEESIIAKDLGTIARKALEGELK